MSKNTAVKLLVGDKEILSTEITYDDLVILFQQFIDTYGKVPTQNLCDSKHNMPQGRIIKRILEENNITRNDFVLQFGKVSHVRTESKDYDYFLDRFKRISNERGEYIRSNELMNNSWGLPSASWFVKYCPNKNIKSYTDFIKWCGYNIQYKLDKEYVSKKLTELQNKLGRYISRKDITLDNLGFSEIVINRLYGTLGNAKKEIGLLETPTSIPIIPFEQIKNNLINKIEYLKNQGIYSITWKDLECDVEGFENIEHKTLIKRFESENINLQSFIKSCGVNMTLSKLGRRYVFDDGERTTSNMEYRFSLMLRELGFKYNKTYFRDIKYSDFTNATSKINCDYKIIVNNKIIYVEIAGIIYNTISDSWREHKFKSKRETDYQNKMILKEKYLKDANCEYLFVFSTDMNNDSYKEIFKNKIHEMMNDEAA